MTEQPSDSNAVEYDLKPLRRILDSRAGDRGALIPILQETQEAYGYLAPFALEEIARETRVPLARIYGVATFYAQFRLSPAGKHLVRVCHGTACHVSGAEHVSETLTKLLRVPLGGTTEDRLFTLEGVACLGCCSLAPVMMVDDETYGRLDDKAIRKIVDGFRKHAVA